jgi:hypothetical protein
MPRIAPSPPITLPPYTFIMCDHRSHALSCQITEALVESNDTVYVDDFLAPIHEGVSAILGLGIDRDLGVPATVDRLVLPTLTGETEADLIVSLEKWYNEHFGECALGVLALKRARDNRELADYSIVFRDATHKHVLAFLNSNIPKRDMLFIHLEMMITIGDGVKELALALATPFHEQMAEIRRVAHG